MTESGAKSGPALVWSRFPEGDSAAFAAKSLLDEWLIACANIVPGMLSLFEWNGERGEAKEVGMLLKTDAALLERVMTRLAGLHRHAVPAIMGWQGDAAAPGTAAWLGALRQ